MSEAAVPLPVPQEAPPPAPRWRADLALVVAAFFFGTTFLVVQDAVEAADPVPFLAVRFLIGGAALGMLGRGRPATPGELRDGVAGGVALLVGYVLQTVGLQYTTPSTSAFITYLLVVFVPLIGFVALRRRPHPLTLVGLVLAVVGLVLLTGGADASFGKGEVLTLGCAVAFAAHIVIVGETAERHDAIRLTCVQVTTVGACVPGAQPVHGWAGHAGERAGGRRLHRGVRHRPGLLGHGVGPAGGQPVARRADPPPGAGVRRPAVGPGRRPAHRGRAGRRGADPDGGGGGRGGARLPGRARGRVTLTAMSPDPAVAETLEESARRIGHHAWIELRLFETLGAWVTAVPELEAKAVLAAQSYHHAWHAELWHGLLPSVPHLHGPDLVVPSGPATAAQIDSLAAATGTVERLAGLYEVVLPALMAAYRDHLGRTTPVTDAPTIRALRLVLADSEDDARTGERLLRSLR